MKKLFLFLLIFNQICLAGLPPATVKGPLDANPVTTFNTIYSGATVSHSGTTATVSVSGFTNTVPNGATGQTSFSANQIILGGTTSTAALGQVPGAPAGYVATSTGLTSAPSFVAPSVVGTVVASYYASANQTPGTNVQINYDTALVSNAAVTTGAGAWKFLVQTGQDGNYTVQIQSNMSSTPGDIFLYKSGAPLYDICQVLNTNIIQACQVTLPLVAGDYIDIRPNTGGAFVGAATKPWTSISIKLETGGSNVSSISTGGEHIERATVSNNGTCTISAGSQSGSWVSSLSHPGTGQCTLNFIAGEFSAAPSCTCTSSPTVTRICGITASSSSAITVETDSTGSAGTDVNFMIICMGPR